MLALLSPAKTLDLTPLSNAVLASKPALLKEAGVVVKHLQKLSLAQLKSLLGVSDNLAKLNHSRYKQFEKQEQKQAMFSFAGPAFKCLGAPTLSAEDVEFAQSHLRILSGVYGILRPCDLIRPYRLDMGKKLKIGEDVGMYKYWGTKLSEHINREMPEPSKLLAKSKKNKTTTATTAASSDGDNGPPQFILNCASQEYSKSVDRKALAVPVIDCVFKEPTGRTVAVFAKRARGMMCRFLIQERVNDLAGVKRFTGAALCALAIIHSSCCVNAVIYSYSFVLPAGEQAMRRWSGTNFVQSSPARQR